MRQRNHANDPKIKGLSADLREEMPTSATQPIIN
jgi:hypothetical protein